MLEWSPMDDRRFLHEGEVLLATVRPSAGSLAWNFIQAVVDALLIGIVASVGAGVALWLAVGSPPSAGLVAGIFIASYAAAACLHWRFWRHATFRVTTERILLEHHPTLVTKSSATIKWSQYQESHVGRRSFTDFLSGSRPLCVRHGTADAKIEVCFPSLRYASDLKHYLDKVESAVRRGEAGALRPFVARPRGRRDQETVA